MGHLFIQNDLQNRFTIDTPVPVMDLKWFIAPSSPDRFAGTYVKGRATCHADPVRPQI